MNDVRIPFPVLTQGDVREDMFVAVGIASRCWVDRPRFRWFPWLFTDRVFDTSTAEALGNELTAYVHRHADVPAAAELSEAEALHLQAARFLVSADHRLDACARAALSGMCHGLRHAPTEDEIAKLVKTAYRVALMVEQVRCYRETL